MRGYKLIVRIGPSVERRRFERLEDAMAELESRGRALEQETSGRTLDVKVRRFEPVQQVVARLELIGAGRLRAGVDVRGDGSAESYVGRLRRRLLEQRPGETAYDALRRVLTAAEAG